MSNNRKIHYQFGEFRFDAERRVLWKNDQAIAVPPRATDVLATLIQDHGELVEREELLRSVWPDTFVEEGNLNNAISELRKILGGTEVIQTVPRRGYRFTADTVEIMEGVRSSNANSSVPDSFRASRSFEEDSSVVIEKQTISHSIVTTVEPGDPKARSETKPRTHAYFRPRWNRIVAYVCLPVLLLGGWFYLQSTGRSSPGLVLGGFENDEIVITDFGFLHQRAQAIALQPDGKIVVAGWAGESLASADIAIARYAPDGLLDKTFDGDGKLVTALGKYTDIIYGLAVQADGKIVAVGVKFTDPRSRQFAILRYKPDGALDASFDGDGVVLLNVGNSEQDTGYAVVARGDGSILIAGSALNLVETKGARLMQNDFAVVRLKADGSVDPDFGLGGKVITDFGRGSDVAYAMIEQPDGRIVVAGMTAGDKIQDWGVARYLENGTLDDSFGSDGKVRTNFLSEDNIPWSLAMQADGKILAAGYALKDNLPQFAVSRYSVDGSLDNGFGEGGKVTFKIDHGGVGREIFVSPDGRIFVVGRAGAAEETAFGTAILSSDGKLIESFSRGRSIDVGNRVTIEVHGGVITSQGDLVLAGGWNDGKRSDFALFTIE